MRPQTTLHILLQPIVQTLQVLKSRVNFFGRPLVPILAHRLRQLRDYGKLLVARYQRLLYGRITPQADEQFRFFGVKVGISHILLIPANQHPIVRDPLLAPAVPLATRHDSLNDMSHDVIK